MRRVDLGRTRLGWAEGDTAIADPHNPTPEELNGGVDLTPVMVTTYEVRADTSDTVDERSVADVANVDTPTVANYMGNLIMFRDYAEDGDVPSANDPMETFQEANQLGFFYRRTGLPREVPFEPGQKVEVYKFATDVPQPNGGRGEGYLKITVPLHKQGVLDVNATVAPNGS